MPQVISSIIAFAIAATIFWLIRRDHLITRDGLKWMAIAFLILIYGFYPGLNDELGKLLGIAYPPIIPVLIGIGVILIKLLIADIERARMQITLTRLVQKIAILEAEINASKKSN